MKVCTDCQQPQPSTNFYYQIRKPGLTAAGTPRKARFCVCKKCHMARTKARARRQQATPLTSLCAARRDMGKANEKQFFATRILSRDAHTFMAEHELRQNDEPGGFGVKLLVRSQRMNDQLHS